MTDKLRDLPRSIADQIIELEAEAIIPVLAGIGIHVSKEQIAAEISKDQEQYILTTYKSNELASWIRFSIEKDHVFIKSIQLNQHMNAPTALRGLFVEAFKVLSNPTFDRIESVVQTTNSRSILLHEKLSFKKMKENPKAIRYWISCEALRSRLSGFLKG